MTKYHDIQEIRFENDTLLIKVAGQEHRCNLAEVSPRLMNASATERAKFEVSPSGYGISWPLLDEDLSVDAILGKSHAPSFQAEKRLETHTR